jgi:hypothetical protein
MNLSFLPFLALTFCAAAWAEGSRDELAGAQKFEATIVEGSGTCLIDGDWVPVQGKRIFWEITGQGHKFHEYSQFHPLDTNYRPSSGLSTGVYFKLLIEYERVRREAPESWARLIELGPPEAKYAEKIGKQINNENLIGAVVIQRVSESDLYLINRANDSTPFTDRWSDNSLYIPTRYSACNVTLDYKMDRATAYFKRNFWGRVEIIKDETVPYRLPNQTFAEQILLR